MNIGFMDDLPGNHKVIYAQISRGRFQHFAIAHNSIHTIHTKQLLATQRTFSMNKIAVMNCQRIPLKRFTKKAAFIPINAKLLHCQNLNVAKPATKLSRKSHCYT